MEDALEVFREMVPSPTVAAWNSMILGYVASGESDVALKFFASMDERPDSQSFVAAMMAVSSLAAREEGDDHRRRKSFWLQRGTDLHDRAAEQGCDSDVYVACTLVDMYSKCGSMDRARRVFDEKCGAGNPNLDPASVSVVALNALLLGYAENGKPELALEMFESYKETSQVNERTFVAAMVACSSMVESLEGVPDRRKLLERGRRIHSRATRKFFDNNVFVTNSLVDFYAKCGSMAEARAVLDRRRSSSPIPWNSMILGYAASGENELALELFASMRAETVAMDARTYVAALSACSNMAAPQSGVAIHAEICRQGLESREFVASSLVDFYAKCGKMGAACQVFDSIATKSTVLWNAVLAGYGGQGDSSRALETFQRMVDEGIELGGVTLLSILTACSRAGLVETGKKIFARMEFQPRIEHYQCMIDLLGRANRLEEALAMIRSMPYDATVVSWTTLLGACEKWKNVEIGELAFRSLVSLDENHGAAYTLMAKILAGSAGMPPPRGKSQELVRNISTRYKP
ncbi:pentatricopeptide repeat-containing protein At1g11290, chloroplastic-like [Selaginella moellendorffii]|uniref:pentatricopeptide repeat-containing protein At1g11290, chloroplastic-like n=1 Tax=Selaginella moellendorffii TaxID=88036 RepID=UPI000D1CD82B|nr:pentatricopeptide repeat-containing protein At1g11290, chloroplastic-like [Selaginella moellendorffii]|eukprot:XP_024522399.1 pentatricopeptide repeat-containing protein At1g11290, chloroplastic-like [Selaginella moellendorffii]